MKGPLYLMHSDVFLRSLQGTGMYFNCFGNFEIHAGSVGNLKKGPELSIFAVFATMGCLRPKWRFTKFRAFKYFSDLGRLLFQPGTSGTPPGSESNAEEAPHFKDARMNALLRRRRRSRRRTH